MTIRNKHLQLKKFRHYFNRTLLLITKINILQSSHYRKVTTDDLGHPWIGRGSRGTRAAHFGNHCHIPFALYGRPEGLCGNSRKIRLAD